VYEKPSALIHFNRREEGKQKIVEREKKYEQGDCTIRLSTKSNEQVDTTTTPEDKEIWLIGGGMGSGS